MVMIPAYFMQLSEQLHSRGLQTEVQEGETERVGGGEYIDLAYISHTNICS